MTLYRRLAALTLLALLWLGITGLLAEVQIGGDAMSYYAYLRSAIIDKDLNFYNEDGNFNLYRQPMTPYNARTHTGYTHNQFSIGPAMLLVPFFLVAHAWAGLAGLPTDGYTFPYMFMAVMGTILYSVWGLALMFRLVEAYASRRIAAGAAVAFWLGSAITFYTFKDPLFAHATSFFTVSLLLLAWQRGRAAGSDKAAHWLLIGALLGLASLMRWQNVLFGVIPGCDLLAAAWGAVRNRDRPGLLRAGRNALLLGGGAVLVFSPQSLAWRVIYQQWLVIPQGGGFMQWLHPHLPDVLASPYHGLFTYTPLALLGVVGLLLLLRRQPALALAFLLAVALQAYVAATAVDWWAGYSFGMRRMINCTPLLAVGLGVLAQQARQAKYDKWLYRGIIALVVLLVVWNLALVVEVGQRSWLDPEDRSFGFYVSALKQVTRLISAPTNLWKFGFSYLPTLDYGILRRDPVILESAGLLLLIVMGGIWWIRFADRRLAAVPALVLVALMVIGVDGFIVLSANHTHTVYALDLALPSSPLLKTQLAEGSVYQGLLVEGALDVAGGQAAVQVTGQPIAVERLDLLWSAQAKDGTTGTLEVSVTSREGAEMRRFTIDSAAATLTKPVQVQHWLEPYSTPAYIPYWLVPERFVLRERPLYLASFALTPPLVPGAIAFRSQPGGPHWQIFSASWAPVKSPNGSDGPSLVLNTH